MHNELKSFEDFIIHCCRLKEWDLRDYLEEKLTEAGFTVQHDNYRSRRGGEYLKVHNMLAMRGKPRICLAAHTDVVRDHNRGEPPTPNPIIKQMKNYYNEIFLAIQDKNCEVQIGGDDRLGVAINTWIALHTGYDLGLLFLTDEEVGAISADFCNFKELKIFDLVMEVDRGSHTNQLVTSIYGTQLCSQSVEDRLLKVSREIGMPRRPVEGMMTDVHSLKDANKISNAVNMTCGYYNPHSSNDYIIITEAKDTMKFVASVIKDYTLEDIQKLGANKTVKNIRQNKLDKTEVYYARSFGANIN